MGSDLVVFAAFVAVFAMCCWRMRVKVVKCHRTNSPYVWFVDVLVRKYPWSKLRRRMVYVELTGNWADSPTKCCWMSGELVNRKHTIENAVYDLIYKEQRQQQVREIAVRLKDIAGLTDGNS